MLEKDIERLFCERVAALGGMALKFTSPQRRNVPDRLVLLPGGVAAFVELKAPGKKPTQGQLREHERLRMLGHRVDVIDNVDDAKGWLP